MGLGRNSNQTAKILIIKNNLQYLLTTDEMCKQILILVINVLSVPDTAHSVSRQIKWSKLSVLPSMKLAHT